MPAISAKNRAERRRIANILKGMSRERLMRQIFVDQADIDCTPPKYRRVWRDVSLQPEDRQRFTFEDPWLQSEKPVRLSYYLAVGGKWGGMSLIFVRGTTGLDPPFTVSSPCTYTP